MRPLLLLHGALGNAAMMEPLRQRLAGERPVFTLDLPGHGGRAWEGRFSMSLFANAILEFLQKENLPTTDIFGYSMGGYAGLVFAQNHPERVGNIITLGTKFDWTPDSATREISRLDPEKIAAKVPAFAQTLAERHAPNDWQELVRRTARLLYDLGQGYALTPDDFAKITCPVTIGLGELDSMVTVEESAATAAFLPNGRLERLAGMPHPWEQIEGERVADWLGEKK